MTDKTPAPKRRAKTARADAPSRAVPVAETNPPIEAFAANEPPKAFRFTAEHANRLQAKPHTVPFHIPNTMPGATVQVNALDFQHADVLRKLPQHLMEWALDMMIRSEKVGGLQNVGETMKTPEGEYDPAKLMDLLMKEAELSIEMCLLCFVDPPLVRTQEDATGDKVWVETIHPADRRAFMIWCFEQRQEEAAKLATFPG
jgi:hypothetical protein